MKLISALAMSLIFLSENIVYGYLDPGSGGGIIAFLVAIAVGLAFYSKKIFYKIRSIFIKDEKHLEVEKENSKDKESK